ncbi:MAG: phosphatase PAP2 family protein [Ruminococcus sp.]|nr:phosphatase PAP2 family protein [Ruminococcus sp.]
MIRELDFTILDWIQRNCRSAVMDVLMPKVTLFGQMGLFWIVLAVIFLAVRRYRKCGITLSFGLICSLLIGNLLLKNLIARSRPCWINTDIDMLIAIPKDYSFPSGHTLCCFIAAVVILSYDKRLGIPALIIAAAVGFSRMYLYVHFPSDVLGGMVIGIAIGIFSVLLTRKLMTVYEQNRSGESAG